MSRQSQRLASLQSAELKAEDAGDILARTQESQRAVTPSPGTDEAEKAKFALPEAAATAIAAGFVLGPVGGLLLGAAQGLFTQRERQNILDDEVKYKGALADGNTIITSELDRLRNSEYMQSPEDQLALDNIQQELAFSYRMNDADGMQKAFGNMQSMIATNETQRVAAETQQSEDRRILGNEAYGRYEKLQDDYRAESQEYVDVTRQADLARRGLNEGTEAEILQAVINFRKALDPGSAVLANEVEGTGDIRGAVGFIEGLEARLTSGATLTETEREQLFRAVDTVEGGYTKQQQRIEADYMRQLDTADLLRSEYGTRFSQNFNLSKYAPERVKMNLQQIDRPEGFESGSETPVTDTIINLTNDTKDAAIESYETARREVSGLWGDIQMGAQQTGAMISDLFSRDGPRPRPNPDNPDELPSLPPDPDDIFQLPTLETN